MEYFDEQYENWDDYDDDDEWGYDDDGCYERQWEHDDFYEPSEPPTRWQRVKAWFNTLIWRITSKFRPNEYNDIPF